MTADSTPGLLQELAELRRRVAELERQTSGAPCAIPAAAEGEEPDMAALFRALPEAVPAGFCCFDRECRYVFVNTRLAGLNRLPKEDHIGRTVSEVLPDVGADLRDMLEQVFSTGDPLRDAQMARKPRGDKDPAGRWLLDLHPVRDSRGAVRWVWAHVQEDIQARCIEEARQESEASIREMFDNVPIGLFESTPEGKFVYVNAAIARMLRYDSPDQLLEEVNRSSIAEALYVHPERRPRFIDEICGQGGSWKVFGNQYRCRDGSVVDALLTFSCTSGPEGEGSRLFGFVQDVSMSKRMEEDLRKSEANFRSFFDSLDDMILVASPEGTILLANDVASRVLGYRPEELSGTSLRDVFGLEAGNHETSPFMSFWDDLGKGVSPAKRKDGRAVQVKSCTVLGRWNGRDCIFVISKDLSSLEDASMLYELTFSRSPYLRAISSLPDRRLYDVNSVWQSTLGYERTEVIGKTAADLGLFISAEQQSDIARQIQSTGRIHGMEIQVRRRDGATVEGLFAGEVIAIHGKQYFHSLMQDVTEHKRLEREKEQQTRALQEMNAALRVILEQRERDREVIQEQIAHNLVHLVEPYLDRIVSAAHSPAVDRFVDVIRRNLEDAAAPLAKILDVKHRSLTGNEIRVASLVRQGRSSKEIAGLLNISVHTVDYYRNSIRRKLGITGQKANLRTLLDSLPNHADPQSGSSEY